MFPENKEEFSKVIYAGESPKRLKFLEYFFNSKDIRSSSGGVEKDIAEVDQIAREKILEVFATFNPNLLANCLVVAADTRTSVADNLISPAFLTSKGKPVQEKDVQRVFSKMYKAAAEKNISPYYKVNTASSVSILNENDQTFLDAMNEYAVDLDINLIEKLSTPEGFAEYLKVFHDFYSKLSQLGANESPSVKDVSSGLSLGILHKMGAVNSINGIPKNHQDFEVELKKSLYNAAVGFSASILNRFDKNAYEKINNWDRLNKEVRLTSNK